MTPFLNHIHSPVEKLAQNNAYDVTCSNNILIRRVDVDGAHRFVDAGEQYGRDGDDQPDEQTAPDYGDDDREGARVELEQELRC